MDTSAREIKEEPVYLFVTGGTFDKEYNMITGELYFKDTHVNEMLQRGRCTADIQVRTLMMVDSLEMTDSDRALIIHNCKMVDAKRIVITHGTDRMVNTAKALAEEDIRGKTIVLTGAMIPYKFGNSSDGFFNLGFAIALVQSLQPGVYIAMNGRIFQWDNVVKNKTTGFFEKLG